LASLVGLFSWRSDTTITVTIFRSTRRITGGGAPSSYAGAAAGAWAMTTQTGSVRPSSGLIRLPESLRGLGEIFLGSFDCASGTL
jgi:hypothetical protein